MLSTSERNKFLSSIKKLDLESNYPAMILLYKILCTTIRNCPSLNPAQISQFLNSKTFQVALARYSQESITELCNNPEHLTLIRDLCQIMLNTNLQNYPSDYFWNIAPGMVSDWYSLQQIAKGSTLDVLHQLLCKTCPIVGTPQIFDCNPYQQSDAIRKLLPNATDQQIEAIWNATFYAHYSAPSYNKARVKKAISLFAAKGKSKKELLSNYLLEFQDVNSWPLCFNNLDQSRQNQIKPYAAPDEKNVTYHTAGKYLALDNACNVLDELYCHGHYDPAIDCTLLMNRFLASIHRATNPVIINPSLQFLSLWSLRKLEKLKATIIVPTRQIALALSTQFRNLVFQAVEDFVPVQDTQITLRQPIDADLVLLSCPCTDKDYPQLSHLLNCIHPKPNCELICYTTEHAAIGKGSTLLPEFKERTFQLGQIICVPAEMIGTLSKRKVILIAAMCSKEEAKRDIVVPIYHCEVSKNNACVFIAPTYRLKRLSDIWNSHSLKQQPNTRKQAEGLRNQAKLMDWSKEIVIAYTIYEAASAGEGCSYRTRAYIQRLDDVGSSSEQRRNGIPGQSCSMVYLRAKTEDALLSKIQNIPFREEVQQVIQDDIVRVYGHRPEVLTIKTIWLCLHSELSRNNYYDDTLAQAAFCGPDQSISDLRFSASFDEIKSAIQSVLGSEHIPIKYWSLLRQIAELAIKHGILQANPLDKYAPIIEAEGRQKVYSIQESLRKWCFSPAEMDRMISPLIQSDESVKGPIRPYVTDSHALLKLFAVYSLARKDELLALNNADIIDLPNGGIQALITKYIRSTGQIIEYDSSSKERRQRRKISFPPFIATCYYARKAWLQAKLGLEDSSIATLPIFLDSEPKRYSVSTMKRCTLKTASKLYRELVESAGITAHHLAILEGTDAKVIDLGLPRKTENVFRNHLMITGSRYGLEDGELSYAAGIVPDATIDAHYIGYDAPFIQIATSAKLHRLSAKYYGKIKNRKSTATGQSRLISSSQHKLVLSAGIDQCIHGLLELIPCQRYTLPGFRINLRSNFGHDLFATLFTQEDRHD